MTTPFRFRRIQHNAFATFYIIDAEVKSDFRWVIIAYKSDETSIDIMFGTQLASEPDTATAFNMSDRIAVGNPFKLFATILHIIRTYYKDFNEITFSTLNHDAAKIAVYDRVAKMIAKEHDRTLTKGQHGAGGTIWYLHKKSE